MAKIFAKIFDRIEDILQTIEYAAWLAGEYHRPAPAFA